MTTDHPTFTPGDTITPKHIDAVNEMTARIAELERNAEQAWRERAVYRTKYYALHDVMYVPELPLRAVRITEWGPGEGEQTTVPDLTPQRLGELLAEIAHLRALANRSNTDD